MKRWMIGLVCVAAALPAAGQELTLRALLEEVKANDKGLVIVKHEDGEDWIGALTAVGVDAFCVTTRPHKPPEDQETRCYPYTALSGMERVNPAKPDGMPTLWVVGSSVVLRGWGEGRR